MRNVIVGIALFSGLFVLILSALVSCDSGGGIGVGAPCDTGADCPDGQFCIGGTCTEINDGDGDIDGQISCMSDDHCPEDYICGGDGFCHRIVGMDCSDSGCPIGFSCEDGQCVETGEHFACLNSDDCPPGAECIDGFCYFGNGDGDYEEDIDGDYEDAAGPMLATAAEIDFGAAVINGQVSRTLEISSVGSEALEIYSVLLDGSSDDGYSLVDAPTQKEIGRAHV